MAWMQRRDEPRLLCMTAAAGAGKSALQQTVAESCSNLKILGSTFFFSATDPTRNSLSAIVPTMAFQLGQHYPHLKPFIATAVADDHHIFAKSLESQMKALIVAPFMRLRESNQPQASRVPYAILIDGLSECDGEDRQAQALEAIKCLLGNNLPFRIVITSRPESVICTALLPGGILYDVAGYSDLNEKYDATEDIRLYLRTMLSSIGLQSSDPSAKPPKWPRDDDINALVRAASGQFIYAFTVIKYVSDSRQSPCVRLRMITDWNPRSSSAFEKLDEFYANILSAAKTSYEKDDTNRGRDFLLLLRAYHVKDTIHIGPSPALGSTANFNEILDLEDRAHEAIIADLRSLMTIQDDPTTPGESRLRLLHESFSDFLSTESRSKKYFIPQSQVYAHIAECCFHHISRCPLESSAYYPLLNCANISH
jgi:hypothetical protein